MFPSKHDLCICLSTCCLPRFQVRDLLLRKKEKLLDQLKALAASIPTNLISATSAKFGDLERQLKAKAGSIEEVDAQRK